VVSKSLVSLGNWLKQVRYGVSDES